MASASAAISPVTAAVVSPRRAVAARKVHYLTGMNSFAGLKAYNSVVSLGLPVSTEQSFAKIVSSLRAPNYQGKNRRNGNGGGGGGGGGALSSSCNAADEIFRIAAIMNGLVLVGVAVGFVLLRIEAYVEESES